MGIETSHVSLEKIQEYQLPPDIIKLCSQLKISEKRTNILKDLSPESSEPIILTLRNDAKELENIPKAASIAFVKVLTDESLQT